MRQERPSQHIHLIARNQLFSDPYGVPGIGIIVTRDELNFFTIQTAARIDLLDREFHPFFVRLKKSGLGFVAVNFADFDDALCQHSC